MEYYFDTEFIEGFRRPIWWLPSVGRFNKKRWFIELISIGIKSADGRKYYAISDEFNKRHANDWVRKNVIAKLPKKYDYVKAEVSPTIAAGMEAQPDPYIMVMNPLYKPIKEIATDIYQFVCPPSVAADWAGIGFLHEGAEAFLRENPPKFYAYFADYDWVLFCTLYGTMMNLPKGFPMYCIDLKQELDAVVWSITRNEWRTYPIEKLEKDIDAQFKKNLAMIKAMDNYPKQGDDEHTADADADFNHRLHIFISKLQRISRI